MFERTSIDRVNGESPPRDGDGLLDRVPVLLTLAPERPAVRDVSNVFARKGDDVLGPIGEDLGLGLEVGRADE